MHNETCPKGSSKLNIVSSWIPSCPASRHSPLQPLGTPTNGRWQLYSSLSFPSFNIGSTRQESWPKQQLLWTKTAILLDLMMARLLSLWLYVSQASCLLPGMLNLPPLYSACYALNPPYRQDFILFLCTYLTWSTTLSPANEHCLGHEAQKRSPHSNYVVSFLNHLKQSVLRTFWLNTSFLPFLFCPLD